MDIVDVGDVAGSVARFGQRYLERVYTARELAACGSGSDVRRLAVHFAAKEATLKTLVDADGLDWRSVEITLSEEGGSSVALSGEAATRAERRGIVAFAVSVAATRRHAAAVVVADAPDESRGGVNEHMDERIRQVIADHALVSADVADLAETADLYAAGMTSHASVNVMLALENEFDVEFPDHMLRRGVFESIRSIRLALEELTSEAAA